MYKQTTIISGFPAVGKSYYISRGEGSDYMPQGFAIDSDSSSYSWVTIDGKKERNKDFPNNYIEHIKSCIGVNRYVFVSSHKDVRDALVKEGIYFALVYPDKSLKDEYIERYKQRGSNESFIDLVSSNWDNWIDELINQKGCKHIVLKAGQYLYDII